MKDELQRLWGSENSPALTKKEREMTVERAQQKLETLDRSLRGREYREVLPAIVVAALYGAYFVMSSTLLAKLSAVVMVAVCLWIVAYVLRYGRGPDAPRADEPLDEYRAGVAAKYDHQIRLLSNVKYWYVLPMWLGFVLYTLGLVEKHGWTPRPFDWWILGGATAICGFTVWLNEVWGVRRLRKERDEITRMLQGE
jgi:hypothetical protein